MLKKFRAAFDVPTSLGLIALTMLPLGTAMWTKEPGAGLVVLGVMALVLAILSVSRSRR